MTFVSLGHWDNVELSFCAKDNRQSSKVKCLDVSLAILYFLLVSAFSVWCWLHRKQERTGPSRTKTLVNVMGENELLSVNKQEISTQVTQITLVPPTGAQQSNATTVKIYGEGYCSMYGICGRRGDGKVLNCPYNVPSMKAIPFLVGCPACLRNFLNQSLFINVTSVMKVLKITKVRSAKVLCLTHAWLQVGPKVHLSL
ncbi:uncharacterized protein LOC120105549 isoform X3 [Phoenix dactylifera]|uniref:Uncharacterized protein LOC120105549 isoform X3 n=1 Tax=Phoenix dactylifera TaxID=42345 RepID=A0A8B8ZIN7_PHODC|nr:uncharacterized protein LOC120105549 isoform X3 [Phoenix dactylifera]